MQDLLFIVLFVIVGISINWDYYLDIPESEPTHHRDA